MLPTWLGVAVNDGSGTSRLARSGCFPVDDLFVVGRMMLVLDLLLSMFDLILLGQFGSAVVCVCLSGLGKFLILMFSAGFVFWRNVGGS